MLTTTLPGHGLLFEGAPHDDAGTRLYWRGTAGDGRAKCSCGELSDPMTSGGQRKRWHREHKDALRQAAENADDWEYGVERPWFAEDRWNEGVYPDLDSALKARKPGDTLLRRRPGRPWAVLELVNG